MFPVPEIKTDFVLIQNWKLLSYFVFLWAPQEDQRGENTRSSLLQEKFTTVADSATAKLQTPTEQPPKRQGGKSLDSPVASTWVSPMTAFTSNILHCWQLLHSTSKSNSSLSYQWLTGQWETSCIPLTSPSNCSCRSWAQDKIVTCSAPKYCTTKASCYSSLNWQSSKQRSLLPFSYSPYPETLKQIIS